MEILPQKIRGVSSPYAEFWFDLAGWFYSSKSTKIFKSFKGVHACDRYTPFDFCLLTLGKCAAGLLPSPTCFSVMKHSVFKIKTELF